MKNRLLSLLPAFALAVAPGLATAGTAEQDRAFFESVSGDWTGPGEIVAGKYKGTKFVCNLTGSTPDRQLGVTLDGDCRVGLFSQRMTATVSRAAQNSYRGTFRDGAEGKGLDIVSGNVVGSKKMILNLNRKQLKGAMVAKLADRNTMTVTVSVRVEGELIPVIGVSLKRVDELNVGAVAEE